MGVFASGWWGCSGSDTQRFGKPQKSCGSSLFQLKCQWLWLLWLLLERFHCRPPIVGATAGRAIVVKDSWLWNQLPFGRWICPFGVQHLACCANCLRAIVGCWCHIRTIPNKKAAFSWVEGLGRALTDFHPTSHSRLVDALFQVFAWTVPKLVGSPAVIEQEMKIRKCEDLQTCNSDP